jgi:hypothetical protein
VLSAEQLSNFGVGKGRFEDVTLVDRDVPQIPGCGPQRSPDCSLTADMPYKT